MNQELMTYNALMNQNGLMINNEPKDQCTNAIMNPETMTKDL